MFKNIKNKLMVILIITISLSMAEKITYVRIASGINVRTQWIGGSWKYDTDYFNVHLNESKNSWESGLIELMSDNFGKGSIFFPTDKFKLIIGKIVEYEAIKKKNNVMELKAKLIDVCKIIVLAPNKTSVVKWCKFQYEISDGKSYFAFFQPNVTAAQEQYPTIAISGMYLDKFLEAFKEDNISKKIQEAKDKARRMKEESDRNSKLFK